MPPVWFSVVAGNVIGEATVQGTTAAIPIELTLTASLDKGNPSPEFLAAVNHTYRISLMLQREHNGWHVDQRQLFTGLQREMIKENPETKFPPWTK